MSFSFTFYLRPRFNSQDVRLELKAKFPDAHNNEIMKIISERWKVGWGWNVRERGGSQFRVDKLLSGLR
jgi:hypothetical protein